MNSAAQDISRRTFVVILMMFTAIIWICAWRYLTGGAPYGNDLSSHFAELQQISKLIRAGETNFWSDFANLGYPLFVTYQPLAGIIMGSIFALTFDVIDQVLIFKMSIIGVWSLMPWAWAWSARHLKLSRLNALFVGLFSVAISDQLSFGLSWQSTWWVGLYSQMWGMLVFAPALAVMMRAVSSPTKNHLFAACVMLSLAASMHFFLGMFAGMCAALWWLARPTRQGFGALVLMAFGSALMCAFWLFPLAAHIDLVGGLPWRYANQDGHGIQKTLTWFVDGTYFDSQRVPWFGTLVFFGLLISTLRLKSHQMARWMILVLSSSLILLLGKSTLGELYMRLPFHRELECIRYLSGVHLAGIFLAATGFNEICQRVAGHPKARELKRLGGAPLITIIAVLGCTAVAIDRGIFASRLFRTFPKLSEEVLTLSREIKSLPSSRILTHKRLGSSGHFTQIFVPVWLSGKPVLTSYGRGYHDTLNMFFVEQFDFSEAASRLFNVGGAISSGKALANPPQWSVPLETKTRVNEYQLSEIIIKKSWFEFVRSPFVIVGKPKDMRALLQKSIFGLFSTGMLPRLSETPLENTPNILQLEGKWGEMAEGAKHEPLGTKQLALQEWAQKKFSAEPRATSVVEWEDSGVNRFSAIVQVNQPGDIILLKATWWPWWRWTARNPFFPTQFWSGTSWHMAPSMQGVSLPMGRFEVTFEFLTPTWIKIFFGLSLAIWLSAALAVILRAFGREDPKKLAIP